MPAPTSASAPFTRSIDQITPAQDRPARAAAIAASGLPANHSTPPAAKSVRATRRPPATAHAGSRPMGRTVSASTTVAATTMRTAGSWRATLPSTG